MPSKIKITRGLEFHPQAQHHEADIPDGGNMTIADLRGHLIEQKIMTEDDLFILPRSSLSSEATSGSPSGSGDTPPKSAVLVKLDESRNDWTTLQKEDEVSSVTLINVHIDFMPN